MSANLDIWKELLPLKKKESWVVVCKVDTFVGQKMPLNGIMHLRLWLYVRADVWNKHFQTLPGMETNIANGVVSLAV